MKIAIASDHAGYTLKSELINWLNERNYEVTDYGCYTESSVDYPDFAHLLANSINNGTIKKGIVICGSGNGVNITVNKYDNVRSAYCWNEEITELARLHNDVNVIALPARFISVEQAIKFVDIFLNTGFEGGRHLNRVNKIVNKLS